MITIRPANKNDLSLLQKWDEEPHVIESDPNDDWEWEKELDRNPEWREQLIAELDGRPIGFIQIIDPALEDSHYWGDVSSHLRAIDIWIGDKNDLGKGYGSVMMELAIEKCFNDKEVKSILIDPLESNVRAHKFYEKIGFKFIRKQKFGEDNCFVYSLDRFDWENKKK